MAIRNALRDTKHSQTVKPLKPDPKHNQQRQIFFKVYEPLLDY
jgi:hypothetical protein